MKSLRYVLPIGLLFVILAFIYGRPVIQNDGISYYALTISLVEDHDFRLENQLVTHPSIRVIPYPDGRVGSYYSSGFAFLYAPFVFMLNQATDLANLRVYAQNVKLPFSHGLGIFLGSVTYGFLSVVLSFFFLKRRPDLKPVVALLLPVGVFAGTPLIFYTFTVPSFAHVADAFLMVCIFYLATLDREMRIGSVRFRNVLLGFFLAFSVVLRNNNAVIVPIFVAAAIYFDRQKKMQTFLEIVAGALPLTVLQVFFNLDQYGKMIATGYDVRITSEQAQYRFYRSLYILFHPVAGIYPWSPITLLATIGLILAALKKDPACALGLVVVIIVMISIRFAAIIFPGSTFGQRLLTHLYIFWVLGLAELFLRWKRATVVLACLCVLWSFALFNTYYILTGSGASKIMTKEGGSSPVAWLSAAGECYSGAKQNGEAAGPLSFWYNNLAAKPYPTLMTIISGQQK